MIDEAAAIEVRQRSFDRRVELGLKILAVATALLYMYTAWWGLLPPLRQRSIILAICLIFVFLYYPMRKRSSGGLTFRVDLGLALMSLVVLIYIMANEVRIAYETTIAGPFDLVVGILFMGLVLEATRRMVGWIMIVIPVCLFVYAIFGSYLPGPLHHAGVDWDFIITIGAYHTEGGVFGLPLQVAASVIIMFLILSSFLRASGIQSFFIDLPYSVFGGMRGGPAKIAVVASSMMGTLTGSTIANVVGTGSFTIPLMKRSGYSPKMAAAIEAVSSSGGQIMPPIMGAAAFIIADFLHISYWNVLVAAIVPAALYYISLFIVLDLGAAKAGLKGLPRRELPSFTKTLARGWFLLIPLVALIYLLAERWMLMKAALVAIVLTVVVSQVSKRTRITPPKIFNALAQGVKDAIMVVIVCAAAGIVISLVEITGIGVSISAMLVDIAGGNLMILLLLSAIVSIVLGMGLSTTACYIFLAILVAPAIIELGAVPIAAHLFILYFGSFSGITPPVCLTTYAAANIAKSAPMSTGLTAWRIALIGFIVPFLFVNNPALILRGDIGSIALAVVTAIIGVVGFAIMLEGYLLRRSTIMERLIFGAGGLAMLYPALLSDIIGLVVLIIGVALHVFRVRRGALSIDD